MKKMFYLILIFTTSIYSYTENTHQWLTIQSYYLLKKNLGLDINTLNTHLHIDYSLDEGGAWQVPYITRGANLEDRIDPVYNYCLSNPPKIYGDAILSVLLSGPILGSIVQAFTGWPSDFFVSTTHFWNPDLGDDLSTKMHAETPNDDFYIKIPNAYKKFLNYANGDYDLSVNLVLYGFPTNSDGSGSCATQRAIVTFRYNTLPGLYNTRQLYVTKITWLSGEQTIYNSPILFTSNYWSSLNNSTHSNFIDCIIYETLGRMCHLLQDMSVPAHTKVDEHGPYSPTEMPGVRPSGDSYEYFMADDRYWTSDLVNNLVGPMVAVDFYSDERSSYTEELFWRLVTSNKKGGHIEFPNHEKLEVIRKGSASGRILGGNLALLTSIMGTEFIPDLKDKILMLEDVGEAPYRLDRMLNQLKLAGILKNAKGVLLGAFTECVEKDPETKTLTLGEIIEHYFCDLKVPIVYNFQHGHITHNITIPWGIEVHFNALKNSLEYLENAVV
ncbi:MAG TPA: LD-carboxypeptidase [Ignavibacteriaceae bacterium]|nr:LD-carboxypeptidase [Ignavibacteriaceae bacterium]